MAVRVEILKARACSRTAKAILKAMHHAVIDAGDSLVETHTYRGNSDWLMLWGVGAPENDAARRRHVAAGGRALLWDLGYVCREKEVGHAKMSVDHDHPQQWLDRTPPDATRWDRLRTPLRRDHDPSGHIVLVGMGRKSRAYLHCDDWERRTFKALQAEFPGRRIVHRPKGEDDDYRLPCDRDWQSPIAHVLAGASLVVARHSNVCVDAVIAGVPFRSEDGAATWLNGKEFSAANRRDFLRRLAWWQWKAVEARQAWAFVKRITE